ncbi:MAG: LPS export ABC transporter periplasmic protein LptC [Candidatus Aureabacteria bacterium]|nr:LPS export ABC transporter periplasmic protein LptC [Candidatus Auribacterota bacterium]
MSRIFFILIFFFQLLPGAFSEEQIPIGEFTNFVFSSPAEEMENQWRVEGKKAVVNREGIVEIEEVKASVESKSELYEIVALKGQIDKDNQIIHVEGKVVITTKSGIKVKTDCLDYLAKDREFRTDSHLELEKEDFFLSGDGLFGSMDTGKLDIKKNIRIIINEKQLKEFSL